MKNAARVIEVRRTNLERRLQSLDASKTDCERLIHCLQRACRQSEAEIGRIYAAREKKMSARELVDLNGESQRLRSEIEGQREKVTQLTKLLTNIHQLCQQTARAFQALEHKSNFLDRHQRTDKRQRRRRQASFE